MRAPRVKICGICRGEDAEAVAALAPDAMGFVFYPPSPRAVNPSDVAAWIADLPANILKVGVFVDVSPLDVSRILRETGLDVAQLHGNESLADCLAIGGVIWKVVHLDRELIRSRKGYPVDAFLVDSYCAESPGGAGRVGDWDRAARFVEESAAPVWLAGGLRLENVAIAIRKVRPYGVDVSSGVEECPGKKDLSKVKDFINRCREE